MIIMISIFVLFFVYQEKPVKNVATGARSDHLDAMLVGATTLVVFILTGSTDFAAATGF